MCGKCECGECECGAVQVGLPVGQAAQADPIDAPVGYGPPHVYLSVQADHESETSDRVHLPVLQLNQRYPLIALAKVGVIQPKPKVRSCFTVC